MACAGKVLETIPLSALLATNGFIKGVVVFQGYVADFRCRRCLDGDSAPVVLSEVELEPGVKVKCVSKFCYLADTLGSGGGVVEAARARVRYAQAKFNELSRAVATGGHFGAVPPAKAQCPLAKNSKINPILVTLKSYFLVFNTTCKTQIINSINIISFIGGVNYFIPTSKVS